MSVTVCLIIADVAIGQEKNEINLYSEMLFEPLYSHISSMYTRAFTMKSHMGNSVISEEDESSDKTSFDIVTAVCDKRLGHREGLISADELLNGYKSPVDEKEKIYVFASPFSFNLPDNVLHDSIMSIASAVGGMQIATPEKAGAPAFTSVAVDAVVIGGAEAPSAIFVRADKYPDGIEIGNMTELAEKLLSYGTVNYSKNGNSVRVRRLNCNDPIFTRGKFAHSADIYRKNLLSRLCDSGVDIPCFDGVMISPESKIGAGTVIYPNTQIRSGVTIGQDCIIGSGSIIENSSIGNDCEINATQIYSSGIEDFVKIGPFCHIRPGTHIKSGVKIGDFVEIKNSVIGRDTHASHLTYIGDSDVGERVNFGCGTVTSNYDGKKKYRCTIEDDAFIGCNTNLVAPVTIGKGAYTAAGSTITSDVPENALAIARERQINKENWRK